MKCTDMTADLPAVYLHNPWPNWSIWEKHRGKRDVFFRKKKETTRWAYKMNDNPFFCNEFWVKLVEKFEYATNLKPPGFWKSQSFISWANTAFFIEERKPPAEDAKANFVGTTKRTECNDQKKYKRKNGGGGKCAKKGQKKGEEENKWRRMSERVQTCKMYTIFLDGGSIIYVIIKRKYLHRNLPLY